MGALSFRSGSVQRLRQLAGRRAARWEAKQFVAEGTKLVAEALAAGHRPDTVFLDSEAAGAGHHELAERCEQAGAEVLRVAPGVLARMGDAVAPQPIAAIVPMMHVALAQALAGDGPLVVCAGVQDPGNAGTVVRSAAAAGSRAVIFPAGAVDIYNPKAVRASAGAIFHVPLVTGSDPGQLLDELGRFGLRRLATAARGGDDYDRCDLAGGVAIILGSESHGIPDVVAERVDGRVTIPMLASTESLNVAMAATVLLFEAARQRRALLGAA